MDLQAPVRRAEHDQRQASDPQVSAFVSAHAGTGKTKLLIDRLLRLMLSGADPARILCLTFTKAAAAEMAIRLQNRLATFVSLSDADLDQALKALLITPAPAARLRARALFAQVLDLPGGMRISTTHAFCQSLLRRFPLEAAMSPHFRLVEDHDARMALDQARETVLPRATETAIAALAGLASADGFAGLTALLERDRERLRPSLMLPPAQLHAAMRRAAGAKHDTEQAAIAAAVAWTHETDLRDALRRSRLHGSKSVSDKAAEMEGWLNLPPADRAEHWDRWVDHLLLADGSPRGLGRFCNPKLAELHPDIVERCAEEQTRVSAVLQSCRALRCADASASLLSLAAPILADYAALKTRNGLVDYDDLIRRTVALLSDGGAAWVKYKLDGGIDHLLLDEVQDTSAVQWAVTDALVEDFFAGESAHSGRDRTLFAVGDVKQSIYSFQGAEPDLFSTRRSHYAERVQASDHVWRDTVLNVSFRSTVPVLRAVDAVFAHPVAACGVCGPGDLSHESNRAGQAGSVTLWPLAPRPKPAVATPWTIPDRNQGTSSAAEDLVRHLAAWIAAQLRDGVRLESASRPLRAGDFLVLVRRRGQFDRALVRELKQHGVNVAGLDRMKLTEQLAVQDLIALCEALLLPQDDLSFAEMLLSPLGGLTDDSLMRLAAGRIGSLWDTLRARADESSDWQRARAFFAALLKRVDYATPYALLVEVLGPWQGRAKLFARLGPEAAEPVDELLASAQAYATDHTPSLQGFLHWLDRSGAEVKREAEAGGDVLRIMTVHGAKGLEAPVVILPDTTGLPPDGERLHWTRDRMTGADLFLWEPNKAYRCDAVEQLRNAASSRRLEEYNRLLYVAMTRARDHLLVCGWAPKGDVPEQSWYAQMRQAMLAQHAAVETHAWGEALCLHAPQTAAADSQDRRHASPVTAVPAWAGADPDWSPRALPAEPALSKPLSPSRPDGATQGIVPPARSPLLRDHAAAPLKRGTLIHTLLQHLPDLPPSQWHEAARAYAALTLPGEAAALADQVVAVLDDSALGALFGPGSRAEQGLSGVIDGQVFSGRVDRMAVLPGRVLIADYKTQRLPPADPARAPVLYLRQMAVYRAIARLLYPGLEVACVLVWTEGPVAMTLPPMLLDQHVPRAAVRAVVPEIA